MSTTLSTAHVSYRKHEQFQNLVKILKVPRERLELSRRKDTRT